jgi:serine/threonine-protein kinase HipA
MTLLTLDVRIDGFAEPIGSLTRNENFGLSFKYAGPFLEKQDAIPLSLSLPLRDEAYGDVLTRAFFDNLLQERSEPLEAVMTREALARDDIAGLLLHLGKDCAGAVSVLALDAPPTKIPGNFFNDYDVISFNRLTEIVRSLHLNNIFPDGIQDPSPLAGVQNKFAVTVLPDGQFAFPKRESGAPTTHIIKVPKRSHPNDARQEAAALILSKAVGIETIEAEVLLCDDIEALIVKRFDRGLNEEGLVIRYHQEDFAQALGLPRQLKYERDGTTGRCFNIQAIRSVLDQTIEPGAARTTFVKATIFDLFIGNVDAHAKNHALIYGDRGRTQLSPRYDILPTRLDAQITELFPFQIGEAHDFAKLTIGDLDKFLADLGFGSASGRNRLLKNIITEQAMKLSEFFDDLQKQRLKLFADLIASNIRHLCGLVGVDVPRQAQNRDAFVHGGGGWMLGS